MEFFIYAAFFLLLLIRRNVPYMLGLAALIPLLPFFRVESITKPKSNPYLLKSMGFAYHKSGKRYLYRETVEVVGFCVALAIVAFVAIARAHADTVS